MIEVNTLYMHRALQLAQLGQYKTAPNPMVGAVLVYNNRIIGEGFHTQCGAPHAEVECLKNVKDIDKPFISDATLYVTLEPCSHYGKTPPCAELIIKEKIKKVVIGMQDPNHLVQGKGIALLNKNGIETVIGVLEDECRYLNRHFIVNHTQKRLYITLKWAQTAAAFIGSGTSERWMISNKLSQRFTHSLRAEHQAIAIGSNTLKLDKPLLDTRYFPYAFPQKIVFFQSEERINETKKNIDTADTFNYIQLLKGENPNQILANLNNENVHSILIEGGSKILRYFIENEMWDEAVIITNTKDYYANNAESVKAPAINGIIKESFSLKNDRVVRLINPNAPFLH